MVELKLLEKMEVWQIKLKNLLLIVADDFFYFIEFLFLDLWIISELNNTESPLILIFAVTFCSIVCFRKFYNFVTHFLSEYKKIFYPIYTLESHPPTASTFNASTSLTLTDSPLKDYISRNRNEIKFKELDQALPKGITIVFEDPYAFSCEHLVYIDNAGNVVLNIFVMDDDFWFLKKLKNKRPEMKKLLTDLSEDQYPYFVKGKISLSSFLNAFQIPPTINILYETTLYV